MPKCRECNAVLMWKKPYKKGDRPVNPNGSVHICYPKRRVKASDYRHCELCPSHVSWFLSREEMIQHKYNMHPKGEILDEIDVKSITDEKKQDMRKEPGWAHLKKGL